METQNAVHSEGENVSSPCCLLPHFHLKQGQCLKLQTTVRYLSLLFGELKLWQHKTFQSAIFAFLLFPTFQSRALVVGSGLSQHAAKSLNPPVFLEPTVLLQLLLNCGEDVDEFTPLHF